MTDKEKAEYHRNIARFFESRAQDYLIQAESHKKWAEVFEEKDKSFERYDELDY